MAEKSSAKAGSGKSKLVLRILITLAAIIIVLFFAIFFVSFANLYPNSVSPKQSWVVDGFYAQVPFLPKSPSQILSAALVNNQKLNSYSLNLKAKISLPKSLDLIVLTVDGAINHPGKSNASSKSKITAQTAQPVVANFEANTVEIGNDFYFSIDDNANFLGLNLNSLKDWQKVNTKDFEAKLGVKARSDEQVLNDVLTNWEKLYSDLLHNSLKKDLTMKDVKDNSKSYFQLTLHPDEFDLSQLLTQAGKGTVKDSTVTAWVDKKTRHLAKVIIDANLIPDKDTGAGQELHLNLSYELDKVNQKIVIEAPASFSTITSPTEFALKAGSLDLKTVNVEETGQNFVTLERLSRVLLLLPASL